MNLSQLVSDVTTKLTRDGSNRVDAPDILQSVLNVIAFFATQISDIIPQWTNLLTFQTDGSDNGRFSRLADTNGKVRLFETKVDHNIGNSPPTNPLTTENAFWREVSASAGAAIPEWASGVYGPGLVIVYHNHSNEGKGLYILLDPVRPYASTNIETEITAEKWERISYSDGEVTLSTAGATITLDFDNNIRRKFTGSAPFTTPKAIAYDKDTKAKKFELVVTINDAAAVLTFAAAVKMTTTNGLWNSGANTFTLADDSDAGEYRFVGSKIGATWYVTQSGPYA